MRLMNLTVFFINGIRLMSYSKYKLINKSDRVWKDLSLVNPLVDEYKTAFDEISDLPGCRVISGLPDAGLGNHETPYGVVAAFKDNIVPQLLGRVIGCGMSLVKTDLKRSEIVGCLEDFSKLVASSLSTKKDDYRTSYDCLNDIYKDGPRAAYKHFPCLSDIDIPDELLDAVNLSPFLDDLIDLGKIVPNDVLKNSSNFCFPSPAIKKNHFIELGSMVSSLDDVFVGPEDPVYAFYHFESPMSNRVNSYYSGSRKKERKNGALFKARTWYHYYKKAQFHFFAEKSITPFRYFLRHKKFVSVPVDSISGQRFLSSLVLQINYERVGRHLFAVILSDVLSDVVGRKVSCAVEFESTHNYFDSEVIDGESYLVARKNTVGAKGQQVGVVSGMYNIPSIVVRGKHDQGSNRWMRSYDHGIGNQLWRESSYQDFQGSRGLKDNSRFEEAFRNAIASSKYEETRDDIVGRCLVLRGDNVSVPQTSKYEDVFIGKTLRHLVAQYSQDDAPVSIDGYLIPFMNYKERV